MIDENDLDRLLGRIGQAPASRPVAPEFNDGVWLRVGQLGQARELRRNALLGFAVVAVGLGAGVGVAPQAEHRHAQDFALGDGTALAPSSLLHVSP